MSTPPIGSGGGSIQGPQSPQGKPVPQELKDGSGKVAEKFDGQATQRQKWDKLEKSNYPMQRQPSKNPTQESSRTQIAVQAPMKNVVAYAAAGAA